MARRAGVAGASPAACPGPGPPPGRDRRTVLPRGGEATRPEEEATLPTRPYNALSLTYVQALIR